MATPLYLKDTLEPLDRWAIEAKRMYALGLVKPNGIGIGVNLEARIQKADGFSAKFELLKKLDEQNITYFPNINNPNYLKILVPDDKVAAIQKLAKTAGYVQVDAKNYPQNT